MKKLFITYAVSLIKKDGPQKPNEPSGADNHTQNGAIAKSLTSSNTYKTLHFMSQLIFKDKSDINAKLLFYVGNEAESLSQKTEFDIHNYLDSEVFNPDMDDYLSLESMQEHLDIDVDETSDLSLNLKEGVAVKKLPKSFVLKFRKFKAKVRKIFCQVVRGIKGGIKDFDPQVIIKAVLLALIPAFAGGVAAAALPVVIGLVAYLIRFGIDKTCPI